MVRVVKGHRYQDPFPGQCPRAHRGPRRCVKDDKYKDGGDIKRNSRSYFFTITVRRVVEFDELDAYPADDNAQKDEVAELCCRTDEQGRSNVRPKATIAVASCCTSGREDCGITDAD